MILELNKTYCGDALEITAGFPDESVNCVVTSSPYWGLRDYGTEAKVWQTDSETARLRNGGVECEHEWFTHHKPPQGGKNHPERPPLTGAGKHINNTDIRGVGTKSDFCIKCNAWRGHLGLEPTPELYVEHMVQIFREVRRVLRKDGTLWLNLGDSYWGGKGMSGSRDAEFQEARNKKGDSLNMKHQQMGGKGKLRPQDTKHDVIKPKDLVGIPWMVAFALRADGWYLRSDIIWHKPNPMPESVRDRPTKSHEYIFLLSKSQKYFYDAEAIQEEAVEAEWEKRLDRVSKKSFSDEMKNGIRTKHTFGNRDGQMDGLHSGKAYERKYKNLAYDGQQPNTFHLNRLNGTGDEVYPVRNKRSVWTVTTKPYKGAHFATFPEDLILDCIKAGCPKQVCKKCGMAVTKILKSSIDYKHTEDAFKGKWGDKGKQESGNRIQKYVKAIREATGEHDPKISKKVVGYASCDCDAGFKPGVVFDPFHGAFTTGITARKLGVNYVAIELNAEYIKLGEKREEEELGLLI